MLTKEQQKAYDAIKNGENVFLTGKAGTGKTFVIDKVLEDMEDVAVIAPTGAAAINAKGITIHKFLQLKAEPPIRKDLTLVEKVTDILSAAKTVIVDEVSMCRMDLFDCLINSIQKSDRINEKHTQIVVVGDFCQLPPVINKDSGEREVLSLFYQRDIGGGFSFQGNKWRECNFRPIVLTQIMRQSNEEFIHNLNKARVGDTTCIPYFSIHSSPVLMEDGIYLAGKNAEVSKINKAKLEELPGAVHTFTAIKNGDDISKNVIAEEVLELKIGAKVMFLYNGEGFSNGSIGEVVGINGQTVYVNVNGKNVEVVPYEWESFNYNVVLGHLCKQKTGSFVQIPLKLAYAVTIHKSQGQTYDKVNLNPVCWDSGQLYCALSRVKSIENLYLTNSIKPEYLYLDKEVQEFYSSLNKPKDEPKEEMADPEIMPEIIMEDSEFTLIKIPLNKKEEVFEVLRREK